MQNDHSQGVVSFSNRLKKNLKVLKSWRKAQRISCYRAYDRDLPEYAVAVDIYENWVYVQEYQAPKSIDAEKASLRLRQIMDCLPRTLDLPPENIFLRTRSRQKGIQQYEKFDSQRNIHRINEGGCQFLVNFSDYLDTGLFLDHRITRTLIKERARDRRVLNLFAYTGSASVYAVRGGAQQVTTVDMSNTYLTWAQQNFELNDIDPKQHLFLREDCLQWLLECDELYDLIFLDPPTFSNSKRMRRSFDIQRDHVELIDLAMQRLGEGGELVFSNNLRSFRMAHAQLPELAISDWSRKTLPKDFTRNPKIHNCWHIARRIRAR